MSFYKAAATLLAAAVYTAHAQFIDGILPDYTPHVGVISVPCDIAAGPWTLKFNHCFQIPTLVRAIISEDFVPLLDNWLPALCADTTPRCPPDLLKQASHELTDICAKDNHDTPGGVPALTLVTIDNYDEVTGALCSKNHNGTFCVSEMLHTIQKVIDKKINYIMFRDAINGNSTYMPQLSALLHEGAFCTGCISRFLYLGTKLNTSVPMPDALPSVRARCGAHFGSVEVPVGVAPSPVSSALPSTTRRPLPTAKVASSAVDMLLLSVRMVIGGLLLPAVVLL